MKSGDFLKDLFGKPSLLIPGSEQLHEGYGCQWKLVAVLYSSLPVLLNALPKVEEVDFFAICLKDLKYTF